MVCLEREIGEFVKRGGSGEEVVGVKLKDLEQQCEGCSGSMVVSFGEVEVFVGEDVDVDAVRFVVSGLTRLLKIGGEKVSLLGVAETSHAYSKFLALFPNVENEWDLHLLTVTSATPSMEGLYSKSRFVLYLFFLKKKGYAVCFLVYNSRKKLGLNFGLRAKYPKWVTVFLVLLLAPVMFLVEGGIGDRVIAR